MPNEECLIYYGSEVPDIRKTRELRDTHVVMQAAHPLVASGLYGEFFPHCRRYAYWDPTRVARLEYLSESAARLPSIGLDRDWDTVMLDLQVAACQSFVLDRARRALDLEGVDGLFVDNLDSWGETAAQRRTIDLLIAELGRARAPGVAYFVNRGFQFWHRIGPLAAILLESLLPEQIITAPAAHLSWYENLLALYFESLDCRRLAVPIFALGYAAPAPPADPEGAGDAEAQRRQDLSRQLARHITRSYYQDRLLAHWPEAVKR